jgi:hypothetical protein
MQYLQERMHPFDIRPLSDAEDILTETGPLMVYTAAPCNKGLWIPCTGTLFKEPNDWPTPKVQQRAVGGEQPNPSEPSAIDFDMLSDLFWMLARVEEYRAYQPDEHGRFPGRESAAYKGSWLMTPVVDQWIKHLKDHMTRLYPGLGFTPDEARWQPSIDVDFAWRYKYRSPLRLAAGLCRDLVKEGVSSFLKGLRQVSSSSADPYDMYDTWAAQRAMLFFPVGQRTKYDRNYTAENPAYRELIRRWHEAGLAGIHPSYYASDAESVLQRELETYRQITGQDAVRSRQHYLRLRLPETYRLLERAGIREDWTMCYADAPGFRAGTAHAFRWYDLQQERISELTVVPTSVMDVTLKYYMGLDPSEAAKIVARLWAPIQASGGTLVTLAHHHSASGYDPDWKGWPGVLMPSLTEI